MKGSKWLLIGLIAITLSIILVYLWTFHSGLSSDAKDWGNFGSYSYFGGIVGGLLTAITIFFVYRAYDISKKQADFEILNKL